MYLYKLCIFYIKHKCGNQSFKLSMEDYSIVINIKVENVNISNFTFSYSPSRSFIRDTYLYCIFHYQLLDQL